MLGTRVVRLSLLPCCRAVWEASDEEEDSDDDDKRKGKKPDGPSMPAGMDWLGGLVKPMDDMGKNIGQLFCPFLMPVSQDTMVKEYCEVRVQFTYPVTIPPLQRRATAHGAPRAANFMTGHVRPRFHKRTRASCASGFSLTRHNHAAKPDAAVRCNARSWRRIGWT